LHLFLYILLYTYKMAFWAIEVVPGKAYATTPTFDLKITQLVLPANASDKGRTVLQCSVEGKTFAVGSLKLDSHENIPLDLVMEAGRELSFSVSGKNPVQVLGYYISETDFGSDDDDDEGMELQDDDDEIDFTGEDDESMEFGEDDEDEEADEEEISKATLLALNKRKNAIPMNGQQNGGAAKKPKHENPPQQQQKPQASQKPKAEVVQKGEQKPNKPQQVQQQQSPQQPQKVAQQKPQTPQQVEQKPKQKPQSENKSQPQSKPQTPAKAEQSPVAKAAPSPAQKGSAKKQQR